MTAGGRDTRDGERGQILALMVISLLAIGALVADTGFFFDYRRRMQSGADSAAMAGAEQLLRARIARSTIIWTRSRFDGIARPLSGR